MGIICETEARGPAGRREREIERRKTTRGRLTIILCRASTNKRQKHSFYSFHPKVTLAARCSKHLFATTRTFEPKGLVLFFFTLRSSHLKTEFQFKQIE